MGPRKLEGLKPLRPAKKGPKGEHCDQPGWRVSKTTNCTCYSWREGQVM